MFKLQKPIHIVGVALRTTNENGQSFIDIPPFWGRFMQENVSAKIPNKIDQDLYVAYTDFENEGKNNHGMYTMVIGCAVAPDTVSLENFTKIIIPSGNYRDFPVPAGGVEKVGETWQAIWALPQSEKQNWSFRCEFERYRANGEIEIFIGMKN